MLLRFPFVMNDFDVILWIQKDSEDRGEVETEIKAKWMTSKWPYLSPNVWIISAEDVEIAELCRKWRSGGRGGGSGEILSRLRLPIASMMQTASAIKSNSHEFVLPQSSKQRTLGYICKQLWLLQCDMKHQVKIDQKRPVCRPHLAQVPFFSCLVGQCLAYSIKKEECDGSIPVRRASGYF